jgi:hypothetical protein
LALIVLFSPALADQLKAKDNSKLPITLSLKDNLDHAINPTKEVPDIQYKKNSKLSIKEVTWIVEINVNENGKAVTYTITQGDKKLAAIDIDKEIGSFSGKDGKWQSAVSLTLSFSKAKGKGIMRIALIDFKEYQTKDKKADARKISNWLEIPIQID